MNTTSLFYFLESFTPNLQDIRIQKQIESELGRAIQYSWEQIENENLVQNDDNDLDGRSDGLRHNPNA
ncbi:hypothetical protein APS47_10935 [Leptospira kirschneri serovar Mozdok]|nr:Uncharacterized protein NV38_0000618 [Leptospira kirschneri serovar Mozdok]KPZ77142.1 hypothetical protein APS47_10935 [Leptospira kirschneri serovar Mozdok]NDK06622.1 hypothetical protein [Leptospira kirschneri serovar Mozdok]